MADRPAHAEDRPPEVAGGWRMPSGPGWGPMRTFPRDGRPFVAVTWRGRPYIRGVEWNEEDEVLYTNDGRGSYSWQFFDWWIDVPTLGSFGEECVPREADGREYSEAVLRAE
jgi:hypothetical protein